MDVVLWREYRPKTNERLLTLAVTELRLLYNNNKAVVHIVPDVHGRAQRAGEETLGM